MPEGFQLTRDRTTKVKTGSPQTTEHNSRQRLESSISFFNSSTTGFVSETTSFTITASDVSDYDYLGIVFIAELDAETADLPNHYFNIDNVRLCRSQVHLPCLLAGLAGLRNESLCVVGADNRCPITVSKTPLSAAGFFFLKIEKGSIKNRKGVPNSRSSPEFRHLISLR